MSPVTPLALVVVSIELGLSLVLHLYWRSYPVKVQRMVARVFRLLRPMTLWAAFTAALFASGTQRLDAKKN
jgi:hypothetical protein